VRDEDARVEGSLENNENVTATFWLVPTSWPSRNVKPPWARLLPPSVVARRVGVASN